MNLQNDQELVDIIRAYLSDDIILAHECIEMVDEYVKMSKKDKKNINEKYINKLYIDTYTRLLDGYTQIALLLEREENNDEYKKAIENNNARIRYKINTLMR